MFCTLPRQVTSRERNPQFCGNPQQLRDRSFYQLGEDGELGRAEAAGGLISGKNKFSDPAHCAELVTDIQTKPALHPLTRLVSAQCRARWADRTVPTIVPDVLSLSGHCASLKHCQNLTKACKPKTAPHPGRTWGRR